MKNKSKTKGSGEVCEVTCINSELVTKVRTDMLDDHMTMALAETFKTMGDPTRVRIIAALAEHELCVCDLTNILGLTGSAVSHQLRLLRGQRLIKYRKQGKLVFYSLDDEHIRNLVDEGVRHVEAG